MGRGVCVAFAAAWMAAFSLPAFAGKVSCEGFELDYDGEAKAKTCETRDHAGDDKQYDVKFLDVVDQTFELWVIHFRTASGTIIHRRTADRLRDMRSITLCRHGIDTQSHPGSPTTAMVHPTPIWLQHE